MCQKAIPLSEEKRDQKENFMGTKFDIALSKQKRILYDRHLEELKEIMWNQLREIEICLLTLSSECF